MPSIRYNYNRQVSPPAPFAHVLVRCRDTGAEVDLLPALIDTGADRTIVPTRVVDTLGLARLGLVSIQGVGGSVEAYSFLVEIVVRGMEPVEVSAVEIPDEPFVLVGRDVLNRFRMVLDGPAAILEIESRSLD